MAFPGEQPCLYICHADHDHDRVYAENITEFLDGVGVAARAITLNHDGQRPELAKALSGTALMALGFNAQLDHSWIGSENFMSVAARHGLPVIQWILDHPSSRLNDFGHSTAANSRFLFSSAEAEQYFRKFGVLGARTAHVASVGPSRHSRAAAPSFQAFAGRPIGCMTAIGLTRIGGTIEDARARIAALPARLRTAVEDAVAAARFDLMQPLAEHFACALDAATLDIAHAQRHACMQMIEEIVQITRRQKIVAVLREFPALIQSDVAARPYRDGAVATFAENVSMAATWARLQQARAQVCISNMHDMVHDRVLNGLNAGCLNIVEDSPANRAALAHGKNALFFRYDDDSLRTCVQLAYDDVERAFAIAAEGFTLRDQLPFRFGGFGNILALACVAVPRATDPAAAVQ